MNTQQNETEKEFKVLKWVVIPVMLGACSYVIARFNYEVFPDDLDIYIGALAFVVLTSLTASFYIGSKYPAVSVAMFVCECFLTLALILSAVFCLKIKREMMVAKESGAQSLSQIEMISRLKSSRAQASLAKQVKSGDTSQETFSKNERLLSGLLFGEFGFSALTLLILVGMTTYKSFRKPTESFDKPTESFQKLSASMRQTSTNANFSTNSAFTSKRICSKAYPEKFFRLAFQRSGAVIRDEQNTYRGHISSKFEPENLSYEEIEKLLKGK